MTDDEILLASDLYSHRSLNEFIAYDQAMCQCHDVCRCPGMTDNPQGGPMQLQPLVRVLLTALAAGIGAAATQIDNETLRIAAAVLVPTLAAIGIIPPQIPTKTVVENDWHIRKGDQLGYGLIELLVALVVFVILVLVLLKLIAAL